MRIRDSLVAQLNQQPDRVLIQTSDPHTQRIPWHLWDLWDYRSVEITLSKPYYPSQQPTLRSRDSVRILALGNSEGIDQAFSQNLSW